MILSPTRTSFIQSINTCNVKIKHYLVIAGTWVSISQLQGVFKRWCLKMLGGNVTFSHSHSKVTPIHHISFSDFCFQWSHVYNTESTIRSAKEEALVWGEHLLFQYVERTQDWYRRWSTTLTSNASLSEKFWRNKFCPFFKFSWTFYMTVHLLEECSPQEKEKG